MLFEEIALNSGPGFLSDKNLDGLTCVAQFAHINCNVITRIITNIRGVLCGIKECCGFAGISSHTH